MPWLRPRIIGRILLASALAGEAIAAVGPGVTDLPGYLAPAPYDQPFAPGADYDPALPTWESLLGFDVGDHPTTPEQIRFCFESIAAASPRARIEHAGRSHEGRPLLYAVVSSPRNLARLDEIEERLSQIAAEPPEGGTGEIVRRLDDLPIVIWVGASVHGDEPSGTDAVLALLYHLAADRRATTEQILDQALVLLDPLQNPDGRIRHLSRVTQWSSRIPSLDFQSLQHRGEWPDGRGNHYLLDLNRDWFAASQPETRSRLGVLLRWHPQVTLDLHEMGSFDSYLFSPPREPMNPHLPATTPGWWQRFSDAQGRAFGERGWSCYRGDWNEEFNPNRGASWPLFTGAVAVLEEQATVDGSAIKLPDGSVAQYREAVHHHFVATLTVIESAAQSRQDLLRDYVRGRREVLSIPEGEIAGYVIPVDGNREVARRFAETLQSQGIEVVRAVEPFRLDEAESYWGEKRGGRPFPAGTLLVPLNQAEGRLARAILDFDTPLGSVFLTDERRQLEGNRSTLLYETTAWSLGMAYGLDLYRTRTILGVSSEPVVEPGEPDEALLLTGSAPYGFLLDARQEGAIRVVAALLSTGRNVWVATEPFVAGDRPFPVGTVVVRRSDNGPDLVTVLTDLAARTRARFIGVDHPLTETGPDLGSRRFRLLREPRVAILAGSPFYETTFGSLWFLLDQELGLRTSLLRVGSVDSADLDKYNVILVPDAAPGTGSTILSAIGVEGFKGLRGWIGRGGTLIALGEGTWTLFGGEEPLSGIRPRHMVIDQLEAYRTEARRESGIPFLTVDEVGLRRGRESGVQRPGAEVAPPETSMTVEQDAWLRRFSPQGTILRADLNAEHWIAAGVGSRVPVMVKTDLALLSRQPSETIGRFADPAALRLSGLLWPEARERWAWSSYLVRERIGSGQVIAFLGNPFYRAYFHGTGRLLANAILFGPGVGTATRVEW